MDEIGKSLEDEARKLGTTIQGAAREFIAHKKRLVLKRAGWVAAIAAAFILGAIVGAVLF